MSVETCDVVIMGGGMVGLSIAHQLLERDLTTDIMILDKESQLGLHSSGRNSGVLHAGLYYKPGTLKARVCVEGARRLRSWVEERELPLNACGKVIVPQRAGLDKQLEVLAERGRANGASVEFWDSNQLRELIPEARSASGRALWSPNTCVVKPITVIRRLRQDLIDKGVRILEGVRCIKARPENQQLTLSDGSILGYGHLFNCAGLQADRIAQHFGVGNHYTLMPFKGLYWQLKASSPFHPKTNLYPVPDLRVPFLGIHFTPSADKIPVVSIGPTATPALGRENYRGLEAIEPVMAATNLGVLATQFLSNKNGFRRYVHEQAFMGIPPLLIKSARDLIPSLKQEHIEMSQKVGIRSQLFNRQTKQLEDDFVCLNGTNSTHVLNAISPAFTASFALGDLVLDQALYTMSIG